MMSRFKTWITDVLGYEPRQIDVAVGIGEIRGERVRKWFSGISYPGKNSIEDLAKFLNIPEKEVEKAIYEMRIKDLED